MAAASGPVQTSSGETMEVDESKPIEQPKPAETNSSDSFKVPDISLPLTEKKKSDSPAVTSEAGPKSSEKKQAQVSQPPVVKHSKLSPAEQLKQSQVSIPYKEPIWGGLPPETDKYSLEVLKTGTVIENIELGKKPWLVFGRLPSCDVCLEHPSLSRHHAVVQYCDTPEEGFEKGWYLYDLDSTHGTWVNKVKVRPKVYHRLRVGHVIKFGGSSRLYILQGPEEDREPEGELSVTELKAQTAKLKLEAELRIQAEEQEEEEQERQRQKILELRGCSWGMGEDATEDTATENPFANMVPEHEHLYVADPKKALKGFYEREGCDLPDYQFTEVGFGKHRCVVELPVDGSNGEPLIAEATVSGKKKDAVIACALEACRLLDVHGLLHASKHESRKRKGKNWEDDDFYDSDEDTFLDRTGTIEKKRLLRMKKSGKDTKAETYETLLPKHEKVVERITEIETKLEEAKTLTEALTNDGEDALDAYMTLLKADVMDTKTRLSLKRELLTLRMEEQRLRRLVNIAKPATLPEIKKQMPAASKQPGAPSLTAGVRKIGVAKGPRRPLPLPVGDPVAVQSGDSKFEEEIDDEDDTDDKSNNSTSTINSASSKLLEEGTPKLKEDTPKLKEDTSRLKEDTSRLKEDTSRAVKDTSNPDNDTSGPDNDTSRPDEDTTIPRDSHSADSRVKDTGSGSNSTAHKLKAKVSSVQNSSPVQKSAGEPPKSEAVRYQVKGPALPPGMQPSSVSDTAATSFRSPKVVSKDTGPPASKKKKKSEPSTVEYDASDPDYAMWLPPEGQSGDGRTSLNDKLGY